MKSIKYLLAVMVVVSSISFSKAQEQDISEVVELHITLRPPISAQAKKARKLLYMQAGQVICSGSFISPLGHILTAKHCVEEAEDITVVTSDDRYYSADIINKSDKADLAVIQIGRFNTPYLKLSTGTSQSQVITVIGSPLGLTRAKTIGTVAKILGDILILDCTAVPGNSGGPVLNQRGELVGVVSAMVMVFLGPAHLTVVESVDSIKFFFYKLSENR